MAVQGKVPFVSIGVIHDLHYLVFILAIVHAVSCTVTVLLGKVKVISSITQLWELYKQLALWLSCSNFENYNQYNEKSYVVTRF